MLHLVCLSWLLFRATSVGQVGDMLAAMVLHPVVTLQASSWLIAFAVLVLPLWLVEYLQEKTGHDEAPLHLSLLSKAALIATCVFMMIVLGNTGGHAFIYFQF
jgi:hypothetical protein